MNQELYAQDIKRMFGYEAHIQFENVNPTAAVQLAGQVVNGEIEINGNLGDLTNQLAESLGFDQEIFKKEYVQDQKSYFETMCVGTNAMMSKYIEK